MKLHFAALFLNLLFFNNCYSLDVFTLDVMKAFLNCFSGALIHVCNRRDELQLSKKLSSMGFRVAIYTPNKQRFLSKMFKTEYHHLGILVDTSCAESFQLLYEASEENLFTNLNHWLLLGISDNLVNTNENETKAILESLDLPINSHVTVANKMAGVSISLQLQDMYQIGKGEPLTFTPFYAFILGNPWPFPPQRDNYGGISIKAAVTVVDDVWENFLDRRFRHINTMSKNNYVLMVYVAQMLNFRMNLTLTEGWGYPINGTKNYTGIVGLMQRGEVEIGATGLLVKRSRMDKLDYAGEVATFRGAFMFLNPPLSEVSIIYVLPFSPSVWITFLVIVMVLTFGLMITTQIQHSFKHSKAKSTVTWDDIVLDSIGLICDQGASVVPENVSSRIIFLSLLLLSVFVITSYSAIVVSLLQTSSSAINTLSELLDSKFKLSMRNIEYNINYINDSNSLLVKRVYFEKLFTQPYSEAFISHEEGVTKIRTGLNAFHGDASTYKVMNEVFEEYEKCRLKEIRMHSTNKVAFPVRKGCPYREHITQKARWLNEVGLRDREYKYWFYQKPKCDGGTEGFVSIKVKEFYPVLLILVIGIICAINSFAFELIHHKINYRKTTSKFK